MAESVISNASSEQKPYATIEQWKVQYARFISFSSNDFNQNPPLLTRRRVNTQKHFRGGTWISSSGFVPLKLMYEPSYNGSDDAVLAVSISSRVMEEHYISKMHFSWPQVSCVSGNTANRSRAVFVCYKNDMDQIQKFALRFVKVSETEKFMNFLKGIFGNGSIKQLQLHEFNSELSSQAEVIPSVEPAGRLDPVFQYAMSEDNSAQPVIPHPSYYALKDPIPAYRPQVHEPACRIDPVFQYAISVENSAQSVIPHACNDATKESISAYRPQVHEPETMSPFPPSFTQLLMSCQPAVDNENPADTEENMKAQFMKYLERSSFKELLTTVGNIILEMGDDLLL